MGYLWCKAFFSPFLFPLTSVPSLLRIKLTPTAITALPAPQIRGCRPGLLGSRAGPGVPSLQGPPCAQRGQGDRAAGPGQPRWGPGEPHWGPGSCLEGKDCFPCLSRAHPVHASPGDASSPRCDTGDSCSAGEAPQPSDPPASAGRRGWTRRGLRRALAQRPPGGCGGGDSGAGGPGLGPRCPVSALGAGSPPALLLLARGLQGES